METLVEKKLANGLAFIITDRSRLIAGDRWYLNIVCEVSLPLTDAHFADCGEDTPALSGQIRQLMGAELKLELSQERNFVDDAVKDDLSQELLARITDNITDYLAAESFPSRLFASRYREAKKNCLLNMARGVDIPADDEVGPADFSACFHD